jgi:2-methylcitrate dehydratase PrpD
MPFERLTATLAEQAVELRHAELPPDVVELARQCLLDWFGVTLAGAHEPPAALLVEALAIGEGDPAGVSLVGRSTRVPVLVAALVNGTASHALDFDDVNALMRGHPSVAVYGAALALGEHLDASYDDLVRAFVAGYETMCRVGVAIGAAPYQRGFHATGTVGTFGAATACASLLRLDADRTAVALGLAATQAAGLKCMFGTMTKPLHAGKACENGLLAALLAAKGFTAERAAIEAAQGFAAVSGVTASSERALGEPPLGWHLRSNLFKYHASCFMTHSTIDGLRRLVDDGVRADDVDAVVVHVTEAELGACAISEPTTGLEVKFSVAHLAAMALLGRDTSDVTDDAAADGAAVALRHRVKVADDGRPNTPTLVEVRLRDGRELSVAHDVHAPERDLARQGAQLRAKFDTLVTPALGAVAAGALADAVTRGVDGVGDVRALMALARI